MVQEQDTPILLSQIESVLFMFQEATGHQSPFERLPLPAGGERDSESQRQLWERQRDIKSAGWFV